MLCKIINQITSKSLDFEQSRVVDSAPSSVSYLKCSFGLSAFDIFKVSLSQSINCPSSKDIFFPACKVIELFWHMFLVHLSAGFWKAGVVGFLFCF